MSYEKLLSGYQGQPYGKLFERINGKEKAPNIPAPVPATHAGREVSSILGSDPFGNDIILSGKERAKLLYLLGVSQYGKTTMLLNLILQHIRNNEGVCVLDPHGDLTKDIIARMPVDRRKDVILLNLRNTNEYVFGLNLYQYDDPTNIDQAQKKVDRIMHIWQRLFHVSRDNPIIETYMRKCAETIMPNPNYSMIEIPLLFDDIPFRNKVLQKVTDTAVHRFWKGYDDDTKTNQMSYRGAIMRKLDEFLVPKVKAIVGQSTSTIDMWDIINADPGKVLLVSLDPDSDGITSLIGSIVVAMVRSAGFQREDMHKEDRKPFFLYADEFDRFATLDFKDVINETAKFGVYPTVAHQNREDLHEDIRKLIRSTLTGNFAMFRISNPDAQEMAGSFDTTPPEPEMEEWGEEAIKTPVRDVIGHLKNKGGHTNPVVMRFVQKYQQLHQKNFQERNIINSRYSIAPVDPLEESWKVLALLNDVFYEANVNKNAIAPISFDVVYSVFIVDSGNVLSLGSDMLQGVLTEPDMHKLATSSDWGIIADKMRENLIDTYTRPLSLFENDVRLQFFPLFDNGASGKYEIARDMCIEFDSGAFVSGGKKYPTSWFDGVAEYTLDEHLKYCRTKDYANILDWFQPDFRQLQLQWYMVNAQIIKENHYTVGKGYYCIDFALVKGQELYKKQELDNVIEPIITTEIHNFKQALLSLREIMQILASPYNAIEEASGQFKPIFRPGQLLTSAEMAGRIANMLSTEIREHKTYVYIGGDVQYCWNCGKKPDHSDKKCQNPICQKKLKNEYLVSVPFVQKAGKDVHAIIAEIVERNIADGYLRLRSEVEKEIEARQNPPTEQKTAAPATPTGENKPAPVPGAGALVPGASRRKVKKGV